MPNTTAHSLSTFAALCGFNRTGSVGTVIHNAWLDTHNDDLRLDTFEAVSAKFGVSVDRFVAWYENDSETAEPRKAA